MKVYVLRERYTLGGTLTRTRTPTPTPTPTPSPSIPHSAFLSYPCGGPSWPWTDWKGRVDWVQRGRSPGVLGWSDGVVEGLRLGLRGVSVGRGGLGVGNLCKQQGPQIKDPSEAVEDCASTGLRSQGWFQPSWSYRWAIYFKHI